MSNFKSSISVSVRKSLTSRLRTALMLALVTCAVSLSFCFSRGVSAVNRTWDGGGNDTNWSTAANWSSDTVPSAQDVAIFDGTSTKSATIDLNINVAGIQINAGYTNTGSGTGTITQATGVTVTTGTYMQSAGEFVGGDSALDINGAFTLSGGTFTASSNTTFFGSSFTHSAGGTFVNNGGTVVFDGSGGTISVNPPETFNNLTYSRSTQSFLDGRLIVTGMLVLNDGSALSGGGGGVMEAQAGVTINNSFDGGTALLLITPGSGDPRTLIFIAGTKLLPITLNAANVTINTTGPGTLVWRDLSLQAGTIQQGDVAFEFGIPGQFSGNYNQSGGTFIASSQPTTFDVNGGTFTQSSGTFNGSSGNLDITGRFTLSGGTFTASSNTTFFGDSFTHNAGGTFLNNGGTVVFDGSGGTISVNPPETFHNLTYSRSTQSFLDGRLIVTGMLVLNDGSALSGGGGGVMEAQAGVTINDSFDGGTALLLITPGSGDPRTLIFNAGTKLLPITLNAANVTINTTGPGTLVWRDLSLQAGTIQQGDVAFEFGIPGQFSGNYNQSGGTFIASSQPTTFDVNGGTFTQSSGTFNGSSGNLDITGTFTLSGGTFTASSNTTFFGSNYTHNAGGAFDHNGGTVVFDGSGSQTIDVNVTETYNNLTINRTGGTLFLSDADILKAVGTLTLTAGQTNNNVNAAFEAQGNVSIASTFNGSGAKISFTGAANQTFTNSGGANPSGAWTINKPTGTVTAASSVILGTSQSLTITNATLYLNNDSNLTCGALSIGVNGRLVNDSSTTITLGANAVNNGLVDLQGGGAACPEADSILLRSSLTGTQRNWSGTGTFRLVDIDVRDMGGTNPTPPSITVFNGTNSGNNNTNWTFDDNCPTALSITPAVVNVPVSQTLTFTAGGGFPPYTFSLAINNSGASINATTGEYAAGSTANVTDTVRVTDSLGGTADATVNVEPVFIVTNTNDDGAGSLRHAILNSNANTGGTETISFNIPGPGPYTITPASVLPTITRPVVIDGTTQPGFSGTPIIELNGSNVSTGNQLDGLRITAGDSTVKGLVINRFESSGGAAIRLTGGGGGNTIQGCYIGTDLTGNLALPNNRGIFVRNSANNLIGGLPSARNVISGNNLGGVRIGDFGVSSATGNLVQGNFIGTNAAGTVALGNGFSGRGIDLIECSGNTIGGTAAASANVISGNVGGILIQANANIVQGNFIGTAADGASPLPNDGPGVVINISSFTPNFGNNNVIGGADTGAGNRIAFNNGDGVLIANGTGNSVRGNSIFTNGQIGLDLDQNGISDDDNVTPNDVGDADTGANNLQNFPLINSAISSAGNTNIQGTLNSTANTTFNIDFYANSQPDPSGHGEGQTFIGSVAVTTDTDGNASFNAGLPVSTSVGTFISATATDPVGNTSEFSENGFVGDFTVINTNDSGPGSLRQAIVDSNATTDVIETIQFNIPGPGPYTITPASVLPTITRPVVIDGTTQPGFSGTPIIELNGSNVSTGNQLDGLRITAGDSTVKGLVINRFESPGGAAIRLTGGGGGNTIQGCYIGTDLTGNLALPNNRGIFVRNSPNNLIGGLTPSARNVISGNNLGGVRIGDFGVSSATGNLVQGNFIGTNAAGTVALGNGFSGRGVDLTECSGNTIGGPAVGAGNVISGNVGGILIQANANIVQGNFIGTAADGASPLPNDGPGVVINISSFTPNFGNNNVIGGVGPGPGNRIAFNNGDGVLIANGTGNSVRGNSIFANGQIGLDLDHDGIVISDDVTANDVGDADTGANNLQNFPVITSAISSGGSTTIEGTLNSEPSQSFIVDFYANDECDSSGHGEGKTYLGSTSVTLDGSGIGSFNLTLFVAVPLGQFVTATATSNASNNTSEFSQCAAVAPAKVAISGRLTNNSFSPLRNTLVQMTGAITASTLTDSAGNYSFTNLPGLSSYTVTPVLLNHDFTPPNRVFTNLATDQTNEDFVGSKIRFSIRGRVRSEFEGILQPLAGVTVTLSGASNASTTTDNNGNYSFVNLSAGSYTVTPTKQGFGLTPVAANVSLDTNDASANFIAQNVLSQLTGRIVLTPNNLLQGMNADGSSLVTLLGPNNLRAAISPDGRKIVFRRSAIAHGPELFVVNHDGSNLLRLTNNNVEDSDPVWSPDGAKIAFTRRNASSRTELFTMNADGSNQIRVPFAGNGVNSVESPTWSPDGTRIAFTYRNPGTQIWVVNVGGTNLTMLTNDGRAPDWSPDGTRIIFNRAPGLFTMSADGTNQIQVVSDAAFLGEAAWSPDGSRFVYSRLINSAGEIKVADADGGNQVVLTNSFSATIDWGIEPMAATPAGANVAVQVGGTSLTFSSVVTAGDTTVTPIPPASAGTLPGGFVLGNLAFEVNTTATVTPPITVCFTVPTTTAPTQAAFNSLSVMHNEGGALVDRTTSRAFATRTICASVNSLSPFVLAEQVDAALPSITGLVMDAGGNPLSDVAVNLTGTESRATTTDSDGVFSFVNLTAGGNYNVQPKQVGFLFTAPNLDFVALNNEQTVVFTGTAAAFSIGGRVVDANGNGVAGVELSLEGAPPEITDPSGNYVFADVPAGGDYLVTPFKADLAFTPEQRIIQNLSSDQTEVNFTVGAFVPLPSPQIVAGAAMLINESCPPNNSAIDPGERVTVNLSLTNVGDGATDNLVAVLQATGGVTAPSAPQNYGAVAPGTTVARDFSFTVDPTLICGGALTTTLQLQDGAINLGLVTYNFPIGVNNGGAFVCTTPCGGVRLVVTSSVTRATPSTVQAAITVQNIGSTTANNVVLTTAKLGTTSGTPLPQALGDVPPGGSISGVLHFTNSTSGGAVLSVGGTYTGGTFSSSKRTAVP